MYTFLLHVYPSNSHDSIHQHVFTSKFENSMDPDQVASKKKPSDLDPHCFQTRNYTGQDLQGLSGTAWLTAGHK